MQLKIFPAIAGILLLASCSKDSTTCSGVPQRANTATNTSLLRTNTYTGGNVSVVNYCGEPDSTLLIAGQNIVAGYVISGNDANNAYLTYVCTNGWTLDELHLFYGEAVPKGIPLRVEANWVGIPVNNAGNPVLGAFPINVTFTNHPTSHTVSVPVGLSILYEMPFAAHAVVRNGSQTETAWGQGEAINVQGNWGMYFFYESSVCN